MLCPHARETDRFPLNLMPIQAGTKLDVLTARPDGLWSDRRVQVNLNMPTGTPLLLVDDNGDRRSMFMMLVLILRTKAPGN